MASAIVPAGGGSDPRSDDASIIDEIQDTHAPDGSEFDVKLLLYVIEDIIHCATPPNIPGLGLAKETLVQVDALNDITIQNRISVMFEPLAYVINDLKIAIARWGGSDLHETTLALCRKVSSHSWDAKVVMVLAAFAINYGKFWLLQLHSHLSNNPIAKSLALLGYPLDVLEHADSLKPKFEVLSNLIKAMLDVTKCIFEFMELRSQYITLNTPEMLTATTYIYLAVYWTIQSSVACAYQIKNLAGMRHHEEYKTSTTEALDLSSLVIKVSNIHSHLYKQLSLCYQQIDEFGIFQKLVFLFETTHNDNMNVLKALIYAKDQSPLIHGSTKKRESIDVLRSKNVLLLISDLYFSNEEHFILDQMYTEARQNPESQYEVVWLPIVDTTTTPWNEVKQRKFKYIQDSMSWFSVYDPSVLDPGVIKYIKEVWHFNENPLLVMLDQYGKVLNPNAIHMMWIWGNSGFPFSTMKEEALWMKAAWTIELLADSIDQSILNWIAEKKNICLYGGEDVDWIRRFTKTTRAVADAANIQLEMMYVGKRYPRKKFWKISSVILAENLSHILPNSIMIWFFWFRLESIWHSKMQHGKSVENDPIMKEIVTMLSFNGSDPGWAVISRGTDIAEMAKAKGDTMLQSLTKFEEWKDQVGEVGFVNALNDNLCKLPTTPQYCNHQILLGTTDNIPNRVVCAHCNVPMEKFIMYRCCMD